MSSHNEKVQISLPQSIVKSPGMMFKDKKDPFAVRVNHNHIHNLLDNFKASMDSPFNSFADLSTAIPSDRPVTSLSSKLRMEMFLKYDFANVELNPGKLKTFSDKVSSLAQKAQEIFTVYDLELIIEDSKISKDVYNLLKVLVPEICFFPSDFFRKIQIKQLIITKEEDDFLPLYEVSFCVPNLDTKQKVRQRLYKIIFDHLISANPDIVRKWKEIEADNRNVSSSGDYVTKMEDVFMELMHNTNHALARSEPKRLRELLTGYYPEAMLEERFKERNKEKKRVYRVRFDSEVSAFCLASCDLKPKPCSFFNSK